MANALDGYDQDRILEIVTDPNAKRVLATDEFATAFWSRVARQPVDRTQDPRLNSGIESA